MNTSKRVIVAMTDSQVDEGENKSKGDVGLGVWSDDVLSEKILDNLMEMQEASSPMTSFASSTFHNVRGHFVFFFFHTYRINSRL